MHLYEKVLGPQSILSDFDLCGQVAIKSDAIATIGMVHRLGSGKVRHLAVGDPWVQRHVRSGKIRVSKVSGLENPSDAQNKVLWTRTSAAPYESVQLGTCRWRVVIDPKSRTRRPILLMVTRCEQEPNSLKP